MKLSDFTFIIYTGQDTLLDDDKYSMDVAMQINRGDVIGYMTDDQGMVIVHGNDIIKREPVTFEIPDDEADQFKKGKLFNGMLGSTKIMSGKPLKASNLGFFGETDITYKRKKYHITQDSITVDGYQVDQRMSRSLAKDLMTMREKLHGYVARDDNRSVSTNARKLGVTTKGTPLERAHQVYNAYVAENLDLYISRANDFEVAVTQSPDWDAEIKDYTVGILDQVPQDMSKLAYYSKHDKTMILKFTKANITVPWSMSAIRDYQKDSDTMATLSGITTTYVAVQSFFPPTARPNSAAKDRVAQAKFCALVKTVVGAMSSAIGDAADYQGMPRKDINRLLSVFNLPELEASKDVQQSQQDLIMGKSWPEIQRMQQSARYTVPSKTNLLKALPAPVATLAKQVENGLQFKTAEGVAMLDFSLLKPVGELVKAELTKYHNVDSDRAELQRQGILREAMFNMQNVGVSSSKAHAFSTSEEYKDLVSAILFNSVMNMVQNI